LSRRALAHELRHKGVDNQVAAEALEAVDEQSERSAAEALVTRRLAAMRGLDPQVQTRRLVGMLARKGYPSGLALQVVRAAVAPPDDEPL
jgi:regulatory protein